MVLTTTGKNGIRDLISTAKDFGEMGTGTNAPQPSDTTLQTPVTATQTALTSSTADKTLILDYTLNSVTGNGNTLTEFRNTISSGTTLSRVTFAGIQKTSSIEVEISTTLFIE